MGCNQSKATLVTEPAGTPPLPKRKKSTASAGPRESTSRKKGALLSDSEDDFHSHMVPRSDDDEELPSFVLSGTSDIMKSSDSEAVTGMVASFTFSFIQVSGGEESADSGYASSNLSVTTDNNDADSLTSDEEVDTYSSLREIKSALELTPIQEEDMMRSWKSVADAIPELELNKPRRPSASEASLLSDVEEQKTNEQYTSLESATTSEIMEAITETQKDSRTVEDTIEEMVSTVAEEKSTQNAQAVAKVDKNISIKPVVPEDAELTKPDEGDDRAQDDRAALPENIVAKDDAPVLREGSNRTSEPIVTPEDSPLPDAAGVDRSSPIEVDVIHDDASTPKVGLEVATQTQQPLADGAEGIQDYQDVVVDTALETLAEVCEDSIDAVQAAVDDGVKGDAGLEASALESSVAESTTEAEEYIVTKSGTVAVADEDNDNGKRESSVTNVAASNAEPISSTNNDATKMSNDAHTSSEMMIQEVTDSPTPETPQSNATEVPLVANVQERASAGVIDPETIEYVAQAQVRDSFALEIVQETIELAIDVAAADLGNPTEQIENNATIHSSMEAVEATKVTVESSGSMKDTDDLASPTAHSVSHTVGGNTETSLLQPAIAETISSTLAPLIYTITGSSTEDGVIKYHIQLTDGKSMKWATPMHRRYSEFAAMYTKLQTSKLPNISTLPPLPKAGVKSFFQNRRRNAAMIEEREHKFDTILQYISQHTELSLSTIFLSFIDP